MSNPEIKKASFALRTGEIISGNVDKFKYDKNTNKIVMEIDNVVYRLKVEDLYVYFKGKYVPIGGIL